MPEWVGLSNPAPDFGNALARVAQIKHMQQQGAAAQQQIDAQNRLTTLIANPDFFRRYIANDPNALSEAAATGLPGFNMAVPRADQARQQNEFNAVFGGATPPAAPAPAATAPAAAPQNPNATPVSMPLGLRNNNPLNLRFAGQDGAEQGEGGFARFPSVEAGLSAAQRQLGLYASRGVNTLRGAISRWAPPSENDTDAYVTRVAQATGIDPDAPINLADPAVTQRILPAMAQVELGQPLPTAGEGGQATPRQPLAAGIPGAPSPERFAAAVRLAATGNPMAAAFVKAWEPFMLRQQPEQVETWQAMTPDQRRQYAVPTNVPAQISNRGQIRLPGTPQTNVSIDQRGETEEAKTFGREMGTQAAAVFTDADKSRNRLGRLEQFEALANGFETGRLSPAQRTVAAWAGALGISPERMRSLGLNPAAAINGDAMASIANEITLSFIGSDGIPANNFSDTDRKFISEIGPQLSTNPIANRIIMQGLRAAAERSLMKEELWLQARSQGKSFAEFRGQWNQWVRENPLFPRPTTTDEANNLPAGTFYITPDNQLIRR